jgi:hypothetical protein
MILAEKIEFNSFQGIIDLGVRVSPPRMFQADLQVSDIVNLTSRDFRRPYTDIDDYIRGNLYLWLHQSYHVLWQVSNTGGKVFIYRNTCLRLGERFATLLKIPKPEGVAALHDMAVALGYAHHIIETSILKMPGNWLLKYRNPVPDGLLKLFMFWLAQLELKDNPVATRCLGLFHKMFAKDVDLTIIPDASDERVLQGFVRAFCWCQNDPSRLAHFIPRT